jgi:hypothetical protein
MLVLVFVSLHSILTTATSDRDAHVSTGQASNWLL